MNLTRCHGCGVLPGETCLTFCPSKRPPPLAREFAPESVAVELAEVERIERHPRPPPLPPGMPSCVREFAARVAAKHGVRVTDVLGRDRHMSSARARHEVWAVVLDTFGLSLPETGRLFGFDHTTVLAGVRKYRDSRSDSMTSNRGRRHES